MSSSSPVIGQRYAFAHGRTGVLQQSLLSKSDIDRLLGAHDQKEAEQVLIELKFTKLIDQSLRDAGKVLLACQAWVRTEVTSMTPKDNHDIFDILWLEGDQPYLAYLLKKSQGLTSGISREPEIVYSAVDQSALRTLVEENAEGNLPKHLVAFVRDVQSKQLTDPQLIDAAVSQYVADTKLALAKKSGSKAIKRYVQHQIDLQNIRTVLRFTEAERNNASAHLIRGGTIKTESLPGNAAHVAAQVRMAGMHRLADVIDKNTDGNAIEQALNDVLAGDIAAMWNTILSIESLFAFAATALAQIRLLRAITIGKRNNLAPQQIKQILPPFLSASHYVL